MFDTRRLLVWVLGLACLIIPGTALAVETAECLRATPESACFSQLVLDIGGSVIVDIDKPTKEMKFVSSNDKMLDIRPFKEDKLYLRGKEAGHGTLTIYDQTNGRTVAKIEVNVVQRRTIANLTDLKRQFAKTFPGQNINVEPAQEGIVLYGTVNSPETVEQVLRLTKVFLSSWDVVSSSGESMAGTAVAPNRIDAQDSKVTVGPGGNVTTQSSATKTGRSNEKIINLLKIGGPQQVLLEVKFAEVDRQSARELEAGFTLGGLGSDFGGAISGLAKFGGQTPVVVPNPGSGTLNLNRTNRPNVFISIDNFALYLRFLEEERLGRVLAEPKLVTMSGQEASFLAGGEYPYPVVDDDDVEIQFKQFGVGLRFTPIVGSDGLITLKVSPSVSDITGFVDLPSVGPQPVLSSRTLDSTVQLRDGQTLAMAGLLLDNMTEVASKVPLLGDIPILGALFRSTSFQQRKTDLLIAVTPHLVNPVEEGKISYPGEFLKPPNRFEFYLEGRLEGRRSAEDPSLLSSHVFSVPKSAAAGGMEGSFGHMESTR